MRRSDWVGVVLCGLALVAVLTGLVTCSGSSSGRQLDEAPARAIDPTPPDLPEDVEDSSDEPFSAPNEPSRSIEREFDPDRDPYVATARVRVVGPDDGPIRGASVSAPSPHAQAVFEMPDSSQTESPGRIEIDALGPSSFLRRTTDADGYATVLVPERSSTIVRVAARGLAPRFVRLNDGDDVTVRLHAGRTLEVEVRDADGAPFENARVAVVSLARTEPAPGWSNSTAGHSLSPLASDPARTDAAGRVQVPRVADGPNAVLAGGPEGQMLAVATIHVPTDGRVRVRLPRPTTVTGIVRDGDGHAVAGLELALRTVSLRRPHPWDEQPAVVTDESGRFRLRSWGTLARAGGLRGVRARSGAWFVQSVEDSTRDQDDDAFVPERHLEIVVAPSTSLVGSVGPPEAVAAGAWVAVWGQPWVGADIWTELARVRPDASGRFAIGQVPARELVVFAGAPGWKRAGALTDTGPSPDDLLVARSNDWVVDLSARDHGPVRIELVRADGAGGLLAGAIRTRSGAPAAGLHVETYLHGAGHHRRSTRSGSDGRFRLHRVSAQEIDVDQGYVTCARGEDVGAIEFVIENGELRVTVPDPTVLRGRVVDAEGRPVEGARLELDPSLGHFGSVPPRTDEEGRFSIEHWDDDDGAVTLHAGHDKFGFGEGVFDRSDDADELVIALQPWPRLEVRVVDARDRRPIAAADVGWGTQAAILTAAFGGSRSSDALFQRKWRTDGEGRLVITRPPALQWNVHAVAPGFVPGSLEVDLAHDRSIELALRPRRTVEGRVLDAEGRPIPGVGVAITPSEGLFLAAPIAGPETSAMTDRNGAFRFENLPESARALEARRHWDDRRTRREGLPLLACVALDLRATHQHIDLVADGTEQLSGIAVDETGAPERGANVRVAPVASPDAYVLLRTDGDGAFRVHGLRRVPHYVHIRDGGVQAERITFTPPGDVGRVLLLPGLSITGTVIRSGDEQRAKHYVRASRITDAKGKSIEGGPDVVQGAVADPDFEITGLLPGRYRLEVFPHGGWWFSTRELVGTSEARAGDAGIRLVLPHPK